VRAVYRCCRSEPATTSSLTPRAFAWHDPRQALGRLTIALGVGAVVALALGERFAWATRAVAGWDAAAATLLTLVWAIIGRADPAETHRRAAAEDPGRNVVWAIVLISSAISLFAGTVVLRQARKLDPEGSSLLVILCLSAVACAWLLTHSAYTLRYARLYYRDDAFGVGGLIFPGDRAPDDMDFAYFAFTIGMCFQVSDVTITNHVIRRAVLVHSVLSFAYNTTIMALALNLVFGLLG
jgi:uncharacterized membrane protein